MPHANTGVQQEGADHSNEGITMPTRFSQCSPHITEQDNGGKSVGESLFREEARCMSPRSAVSHAWPAVRAAEMKNEFVSEACFDVSGIKIGVDYAIADAGATGHFLVQDAPLDNVTAAIDPLTIHLPHGGTLKSTKKGLLPIPWLPVAARQAHVVPGLAHASLVSIKRYCVN